MPELPEVQTTVDGLNKKVVGKKIVDVWTDLAVKNPSLPHHYTTTKSELFFNSFKKIIVGTTIKSAERRGKNILIHLTPSIGNKKKYSIWIHMKMTGHIMYGKYAYDKKTNSWKPDETEKNTALRDPFNKFLHTVFVFSNKKHLVISDMRKFGKVTVIETTDIQRAFSSLGPEPLDDDFNSKTFNQRLNTRPNMPIKIALLDQNLVAGVGNIYSDEALWLSGIHPTRKVSSLSKSEMTKLYKATIDVLKKGINFGGDSMSDYRNIDGERGEFQNKHEAYRRTNKPCRKKGCTGTISRLPIGGRSAHFCNTHQK